MHLLVSGGFSILELAAGWLVTKQACDSASWHGAVCHVHVCVQLLPSQLLSLTTFSAPGAFPAGRRQGSLDRASPLQQRHYYEEADPDRALAMLARTTPPHVDQCRSPLLNCRDDIGEQLRPTLRSAGRCCSDLGMTSESSCVTSSS